MISKNKRNPPQCKRKAIPKRKIVQISSFERTNSEHSVSVLDCQIKDILELLQPHFESISFASLLTAKDVLALSFVCKSFRKIFNGSYLRLVVRLGNLDAELRHLFWIHCAPYARYSFCDS
eukprot:TRINITY_DN2316_c0_g1_i14.p4 TRINITY_DN2316_c0_g1~~TRINITY_DN2316_c0_g1_i14.p4  ORF type:complete len:121 (+),score=29.70 TRINITY_DN2316_c0_g1_i14:100-462(+)